MRPCWAQARFSKLSHEDTTARLISERHELQRQNVSLQRQQAQVQHELKRKDRDYEHLQDRFVFPSDLIQPLCIV